MIEYMEAKTFLPWKQKVVYCDIYPYKMDDICMRKKLKIKFEKDEMQKDEFRIVFATIDKKDRKLFEECLREFERFLLITGQNSIIDKFKEYHDLFRQIDIDNDNYIIKVQ